MYSKRLPDVYCSSQSKLNTNNYWNNNCFNTIAFLNLSDMGLMDFFKKGTEKPAETKKTTPGSPLGSPAAGTTPGNREYVVKSGDSLSKIAKEFYGNANDWKKIHEANRDTIKNPDLIHPGQKIIIP
jgi:hypothetical protein